MNELEITKGTTSGISVKNGLPAVVIGEEGKSAYEVAVLNGFDGTETEWLESLKGEKGDNYTLTETDKSDIAEIAKDLIPISDYETKEEAKILETDVKEYADDKDTLLKAEVKDYVEKTADNKDTVIKAELKEYVDEKHTTFETDIKEYTDGKDTVIKAELKEYVDNKHTAVEKDLKEYADGKDTVLRAEFKEYADDKDATLKSEMKEYVAEKVSAAENNSKAYTNTEVKSETDARVGADNALSTRINANKSSIDVLNGSGDGSVVKTVANAIAEIIANAPTSLDTLKEISDWITNHSSDATSMNSAITANTEDIKTLERLLGNLPDGIVSTTVVGYIKEFAESGDNALLTALRAEIANAIATEKSARETADTKLEADLKIYVDEKATAIDERVTTQIESARIVIEESVETNATAIDVLNGEGTGSVKKTVSDAIAELIANAPENLDTLKKISDWITNHSNDAASMNDAILQNAEDIDALEALIGALPEGVASTTVIEYIREVAKAEDNVLADTLRTEIAQAVANIDLSDYVKNTDYATDEKAGVIKASNLVFDGIHITEDGHLALGNDTDLIAQRVSGLPIRNQDLDYAVKEGVTNNDETLTEEEQTKACAWLGAVRPTDYATNNVGGTVKVSSGDTSAAVYRTNEGYLRLGNLNSFIVERTLYQAIRNQDLDFAVMTSLTAPKTHEWTDTEKTSARGTLGALGDTDYATDVKAGIVKVGIDKNLDSVYINDQGYLKLGNDSAFIQARAGDNAIRNSDIDYAVMKALTDPIQHEWTGEEKALAQKTLGVSVGEWIEATKISDTAYQIKLYESGVYEYFYYLNNSAPQSSRHYSNMLVYDMSAITDYMVLTSFYTEDKFARIEIQMTSNEEEGADIFIYLADPDPEGFSPTSNVVIKARKIREI